LASDIVLRVRERFETPNKIPPTARMTDKPRPIEGSGTAVASLTRAAALDEDKRAASFLAHGEEASAPLSGGIVLRPAFASALRHIVK
jgi:hypothetical protein